MDRRTFLKRAGTGAILGATALSIPSITAEIVERTTPPEPLDPYQFAIPHGGGIHWAIQYRGAAPSAVTVIGPKPTVDEAVRMQEFLFRRHGTRPPIRWAGSIGLVRQALTIVSGAPA